MMMKFRKSRMGNDYGEVRMILLYDESTKSNSCHQELGNKTEILLGTVFSETLQAL